MNNDLIVYIVEECPYCNKLIELLEREHLGYDLVLLEKDSTALEQIKKAYRWSTVPMVFRRRPRSFKLVGGYSDFKAQLDKGWAR